MTNFLKNKLLFFLLSVLAIAILGTIIIFFSFPKNNSTNLSKQQRKSIVFEKSTEKNVIDRFGKASFTTNISGNRYLHYRKGGQIEEDVFFIRNDLLIYQSTTEGKRVDPSGFFKKEGVGKIYFSNDSALVWHVYAEKGLAIEASSDTTVKTLRFAPMGLSEFENKIARPAEILKEAPRPDED